MSERIYNEINPQVISKSVKQKPAVVIKCVKCVLFKLFLGITKAFQFHAWFLQILPQWLHLQAITISFSARLHA